MSAGDKERLKVLKRKILRRIFGQIKDENQEYRIRFNHELIDLMEGEDVVKFIKVQRLSWAGHIMRMDTQRAPRGIGAAVCMGTRTRDRPGACWWDEVERDIRRILVAGWRRLAEDRDAWRSVVVQAKVHPEL